MRTKLYLLTVLFLCMVLSLQAQPLTVATFNLRYNNPHDTGNLWKERAPVVSALIRFHDFDVVGTQEGYQVQLDDLIANLPEYRCYGLGRDDGAEKGEHSAILFKKDKFKLLQKGDFWLSQTPEKPSLGWDATCCNRICSWVYLQDVRSKKKFYFFNAHYDHQGVVAREESSKLILAKIKSIAGKGAVILTGDLNGGHNSSWYKRVANSKILKDTFTQTPHPYMNQGSFNDFGKNLQDNDIIDHVFTTPVFKTERWGVLTDTYHGKYPSDHFPVVAKLLWQ
jgi:endonuclease/exonuclease/phosphatase family metal-dependent hydrolase